MSVKKKLLKDGEAGVERRRSSDAHRQQWRDLDGQWWTWGGGGEEKGRNRYSETLICNNKKG